MLRRRLAAGLALALVASAAAPSLAGPIIVDAAARRDLALTVYSSDLGLVREAREARLDAGTVEVQLRDVPSGIDSTSVVLRAVPDPAAVAVVEQRYAFDLMTPQALLARYVGREIELRLDGRLVRARLLAVAGGPVYEVDGKVLVDPDASPVLPAAPDELVPRPTLFWRLSARQAGPQRLDIAYLTAGLAWAAVYTLVLDRDATRGDLTGWASITNRSGADYRDAAVSLVAGDVNRAPGVGVPEGVLGRARVASSADARLPREEAFSAYHLYTLEGRTSLRDNETTQVRLVDAPRVAVKRRLVYQAGLDVWQPRGEMPPGGFPETPVSVILELTNSQAAGLGRPLPAGTVRVLEPDAQGVLRLAGEDAIGHTARDEMAHIRLGSAFDVVATRRQVEWTRVNDRTHEVEWEIRLRNRSAARETVRVIESVPGDWRLLRASVPGQKVDASTLRFDVPVPAGGEATVTYRVRSRW